MLRTLRREYRKRGAKRFIRDAPRFAVGLAAASVLQSKVEPRTLLPSEFQRAESVTVSDGFTDASTTALDPPTCGGRRLPGDTTEVVHPPRHTYRFRDARLVGPDAIPVTRDGEVLLETGQPAASNRLETSLTNWVASSPCSFLRQANGLFDVDARATERYDSALSLLSPWDDAYYHWIIEILPRLQSLEDPALEDRESFEVLLRSDPPEFAADSLACLGFDADEFTSWEGGVADVGELAVSSDPRPSFTPSAAACRWLRERVSVGAERDGREREPNRLYVSRENASVRRVTNEAELAERLAELGFTVVEPGNHSFAEQVRLFGDADIVVGPHGAGLTNAVFADSPTVVELFGRELRSHYYLLTTVIGGTYRCVSCEPDGKDMLADPNAIVRTIRRSLPSTGDD